LRRKSEEELDRRPDFLVQGTLYPDVIESCPPLAPGRATRIPSRAITTSGVFPRNMKLKLVEPLKWLFKDEVRDSLMHPLGRAPVR